MACKFNEQNKKSIYSEQMEKAWFEFSKSIIFLIEFAANINSTGDPQQLQTLSDLASQHIRLAEDYCNTDKEKMELNVNEHLKRRLHLESQILEKEKKMSSKKSLLEKKEKELKKEEEKVDEAYKKCTEEGNKYYALDDRYTNTKFGSALVNVVSAGLGFGVTVATGGLGAPLAIGCQSAVTAVSFIALKEAKERYESAKYDWNRRTCELEEHRKEKEKLLTECEKLQNECDECVKEKAKVNEEYSKLLTLLKESTQFLECLLNCRQFISVAMGRTEILQEERKDYLFQHNLHLLLEEIGKHLTSIPNLNLLVCNFEMQQLCENLRGQLAKLPNPVRDDLSDDYI